MTPTDTIEQEAPTRETLWITDAELIRRMGVPERTARQTMRELDKHYKTTGFPQKDPKWGDRRYWPALKEWFDADVKRKMRAIPTRKAS